MTMRSQALTLVAIFLLLLTSDPAAAQHTSGPWSLEECINYAINNNADVRASQLDLESSKAAQVQAKASLLPNSQLGANHFYNFGRSIDPFTNQYVEAQIQANDFNLNSSLVLFNGLQKQNVIRQNNLSVKANQEFVEQANNTVSLNIALAYLSVLQNEELLEIANRQVTTSRSQSARAEKLVAAGAMASYTLADLQVQAGNDELELVNAQNNLITAKLNLMQLMNLPATTDFQVQKLSVNAIITSGYDKSDNEIYDIAEKTQPNILGADFRVKSTARALQAAKGTLLPSISMFGYIGSAYSSAAQTSRFVADGTGYTTREVTSATDYVLINGNKQPIIRTVNEPNGSLQSFYYFDQLQFNLRKSIGLNLTIPILNGWQARNRISTAVINKKRAEFIASTERIKLRQNIEQAFANLTSSQARFQTSTKQAEATEIAYQAAQKRFENGSTHFVDLNLAKTNYDRAQSNLVRVKYEFVFRKKILDFYQNKPITLQE